MTDTRNIDWRGAFRLHAMDLDSAAAQVPAPKDHWILKDRALRSTLEDLQNAYRALQDAGCSPPPSAEINQAVLLSKLGFAFYEEPATFLAAVKFTVAFFTACARERWSVQAQLCRLLLHVPRRGRPWTRLWDRIVRRASKK